MDMEHDDLLGGDPGPVASPANLEGVLRRHLRRRRRFTAGVAGVVLAISLGGGAAVGEVLASGGTPAAVGAGAGAGQSKSSTSSTAGSSNSLPVPAAGGQAGDVGGQFGHSSATAPTGLTWGAVANAAQGGEGASAAASATSSGHEAVCASCPLRPGAKRLFERSAGGVALRVYSLDFSGYPVPVGEPDVAPAIAVCDPFSSLLVEASDSGAVGEVTVPDPRSAPRPVDVVDLQVLGLTEGSPMAVLVVRTGPSVHEVVATFASGARDEMAVVDGVAVLATVLPQGATAASATTAQVEALGASGQRVTQFAVPQAPALAEPRTCLPMLPGGPATPPRTGGAGGSAGSGPASTGGSAGSGRTSSGTTSSGTTSTGSAPAGSPTQGAGSSGA